MSRIIPRSRFACLAPRLVFAGIATASAVAGAIAGCGIDYEGQLVTDGGGDASENVGAMLPPEGGADGGGDGGGDGASTDGEVDADAADADADAGPSCADSRCVDAGGGCDPTNNACTFRCDAGSSCASAITCPPGVPCHVTCAGADSCAAKIDCTQASACKIGCLGARACKDVVCAGSSCDVRCLGLDSCAGAVRCEAGTCDIACLAEAGPDNCKDRVICESSVACRVVCDKDGCNGGVTATAPDAAIICGANACAGGEKCKADYCELGCKSGPCATKLCCEAGTCLVDGGMNTCL